MVRSTRGWSAPEGQQYALRLATSDPEAVRLEAAASGNLPLFDAALAKHVSEPVPAFLHSVLCAMSLPTKRPKGDLEFQAITRRDRNYLLAITPKPVFRRAPNGEMELQNLGVPFGAYPRIILINILSQAVLKKTRNIYLGGSFRDMMRRFGYEGASRGQRGQTDRLKEQMDRLLACEWMIHWEDQNFGEAESAFKVNEVKLSHEYAGLNGTDGSFNRELRLAEAFYDHLQEHAVRFDMNAIYALRNKPTAIDLYTYLAFRLPRIQQGKPVELDYTQLAAHMGNKIEAASKIRQTLKLALNLVGSVYPEARVDVGDMKVRLHKSPSPMPDLVKLVGSAGIPPKASKKKAITQSSKAPEADEIVVTFPSGSLRFGAANAPFLAIARQHGNGYDVDGIAESYRGFLRSKGQNPTGDRLMRSFEGFCRSYRPTML